MSKRLPCKVMLLTPSQLTILEECLARCRQIRGVDHVVAAIADDPASDIVAESIAYIMGVDPGRSHIIRGPEHDVLQRHIIAAEAVGADTIMRVTSDCPLIDPDVCSLVLQAYRDTGVDYCTNALPRSWPHGLDCEVFSLDLLKRAAEADEAKYPGNREGVDVWMQYAPEVRRHNVVKPGASEAHIRWTLDEAKDYVVICNEIKSRRESGRTCDAVNTR
jgi:spore coat polysaccharide biosynthesis protein SpsF (cytidylyltransferase family)